MNRRDFALKELSKRGVRIPASLFNPPDKDKHSSELADSILSKLLGLDEFLSQTAEMFVTRAEKLATDKIDEHIAKIEIPKDGTTPTPGVDYPTMGQIKQYLDEKVAAIKVKPGKPGKSVDINEVVEAVLAKIPPPTETLGAVEPEKLDTQALFDEFIEKIKNEKLLGTANLKDYDTFVFNNTRYKVSELMHGGGSSSSSSSTDVWGEVVSGSGTTFTLANTPDSGTVRVFANGQRLALTTDYTISGATITTVLSWDAGMILADYSYT